METKESLVNIITPMYNAEPFLDNTIKSVLNQTYINFEWIIVDDGSKDNSFNIVNAIKDRRIILIKNTDNRGAAHARNVGLEHAKGDYVMFLDADNTLDDTFFINKEKLL